MTSKIRSHWNLVPIIIGIGLVFFLIIVYFSSQHKGSQFINAVEDKQFYIEGELGSLTDPTEVHFRHFTEYMMGSEHGIKNGDSSYYAEGTQYYYGEEEDQQRSLIPEEHNPEEIFSRESVISNRDFSQLSFCCKGSEEIMKIETMERFFCHYEEYSFKDTGECIRLYFRGDQLYALKTKEDARYIFYVSTFSEEPEQFIGVVRK